MDGILLLVLTYDKMKLIQNTIIILNAGTLYISLIGLCYFWLFYFMVYDHMSSCPTCDTLNTQVNSICQTRQATSNTRMLPASNLPANFFF